MGTIFISMERGGYMKKSTRRWLVGSGLAATGLGITGAAYCAMTQYLVNVALNRQVPRYVGAASRRLAGELPDRQFMQRRHLAGERLKGKGGVTVEAEGRDGVRLVGHWFAHPSPKRVLVAMHGWRSNWSDDFGMISDFWFKHQCSVLYAEQRGQGESGGEYMGFGLLERHDCLAWVRWVNEQMEEKLPVYLCGVSMGASTVLMAAGLELPSNVSGIIADCGYSSPEAIWRHIAQDNLGVSYTMRSGTANALCRRKICVGIDDYSCVDAMGECEVPVLFVHGSDDRFVPIEMTYENYKACTGPKRLLVVPGAGHGMSYLVDRKKYEETVLDFWRDFDGTADG